MGVKKKKVLMNSFAGPEYSHRHREQTCGHSGKGRVGRIARVGL